jgi:FkbM family methyltransferase
MTEEQTLKLTPIIVKPGSCCLDVGANIGEYTLPLAKAAGSKGLVLAYEPEPGAHTSLVTNVAHWQAVDQVNLDLAPIVPLRLALSDGARVDTFMVYQYWTMVEVDDPRHAERVRHAKEEQGRQPFKAVLSKLDWARPARKVDFIKLDVDGYELKVLRGARWTLVSDRPTVLIELGDFTLKYVEDSVDELLEFLWKCDYRLYVNDGVFEDPRDARRLVPDESTVNGIAVAKEKERPW